MIVGIIISAVVAGRKNRENYTPVEAIPATPSAATPDAEADNSGEDASETVTEIATEDAETLEVLVNVCTLFLTVKVNFLEATVPLLSLTLIRRS